MNLIACLTNFLDRRKQNCFIIKTSYGKFFNSHIVKNSFINRLMMSALCFRIELFRCFLFFVSHFLFVVLA